MTDLSTTPTAEIAARVIDLHKKATPGPWFGAHSKTYAARIYRYDGTLELNVGAAVADQDAALIAYYRTACVELAKRCLQAEAVAAKSREGALIWWRTDKPPRDRQIIYLACTEIRSRMAEFVGEAEWRDLDERGCGWYDDSISDWVYPIAWMPRPESPVVFADNGDDIERALKSSRTDSGQSPATNADESGRATEEGKGVLGRYLVFQYESYYPCGGWQDFVGAYDAPEAARMAHPDADDIIDKETGEAVTCTPRGRVG